ncbi:calaxin-like [Uloborus diversus]|uniref:calaxin-like n=1 Tax=Uloborus diversus TaxID=327109 RepID=UPI0024092EAA|nr:calaxin-like [Uloborus diversus]
MYSLKRDRRKKKEQILIAKLEPETNFSEKDLTFLIRFFKSYVGDAHFMDEFLFTKLLFETFGYMEHFFMLRVLAVADRNKDGQIDIEEFVRLMSIILRGTREEKIECKTR